MAMNLEQVEGFAELFHHYYSALAPDFGCAEVEANDWDSLPANERRRFVAATRLALQESESCFEWQTRRSSPGRSDTEGRECGC
ncbi:MAG: hypothetical protein WAM71_16700 [Candidatus Korobacteraceae bacterium]